MPPHFCSHRDNTTRHFVRLTPLIEHQQWLPRYISTLACGRPLRTSRSVARGDSRRLRHAAATGCSGDLLTARPARGASRRNLRGRCVPREAVSEGTRRGDRVVSGRRGPGRWRIEGGRATKRNGGAVSTPASESRRASLPAGSPRSIVGARNRRGIHGSTVANHRSASTATIGSRHARAPVTATCARATSGAPRMDLAHGPVYHRHNCVGQRRCAARVNTHVDTLTTGLRSRKRHAACVRTAACTPHGRTLVPGVPMRQPGRVEEGVA